MLKKASHLQNNKFVRWFSNKSSYFKNKTINALLFFFACFIIGGSNYCLIFGRFVPVCFALDFFMIIILLTPIFFFKKTMFDRIYIPIILLALTFFYALNSCFYEYFGTIFPLKDVIWAIENAIQVGMHSSSLKWSYVFMNIALYVVFALGIILFNALWKFQPTQAELERPRHKKVIFSILSLFSSMFLFEFTLQMWNIGQRANNYRDIDYVNYSQNLHFKNLGMLGYYTQEARQLFWDKGESVEDIKDYLTHGTYLNDDYTNLLGTGAQKPNVIVIMVETGDQCMMSSKAPIHLNEMLNNGVYCINNSSYNHTNVSDTIGINGNQPQYHLENAKGLALPFNLPNILKQDENGAYETYFTSDLADINDIYHTRQLMRDYGFSNCLYHDEVIPSIEPWRYDYINYTRDSIFMDGLCQKIQAFPANKPFYMHYVTIHMHMDQVITPQNKQTYEDLEQEFGSTLDNPDFGWDNPFDPNSENGKRYRRFSLKYMDFDKGLGQLMDLLYKNDSRPDLQNTLLVVFGDHSWYENTTQGTTFGQEIRHIYDNKNISQYSSILGFYHPVLNQFFESKTGGHDFAYPTWPTVVVPTILDLLGVRYNPRIYLNKSIFDSTFSNEEIFYSFWTTVYMNHQYASSDHYHITDIINDDGTKADFISRMSDIRYQLRIIDSIYKQNLFSKYNYEEFLPLSRRILC